MQTRKLNIDQSIIIPDSSLRYSKPVGVKVVLLGDILIVLVKVQLRQCNEVN